MIFIKEETYRRINMIRAAVVLFAAAGLSTAFFSGCSPAVQAKEPQGTSVIASSAEDKDNYEKADYTLSQVEGNVSRFEIGLIDDRTSPQYVISGKYAYFLSAVGDNYELKRINIDDPSSSGVARFEFADHYCCLYSYAFRYEGKTEVTFMDLDLNAICKIPKTEYFEDIIPYKDSYIVICGDDLQLVKNGSLEPFRKLKQSNFSLLTSEVTEENTWLLFTDNNDSGAFTYYIYNVNEDKYETVTDMGFNYYSDGFYDINGRRVMYRKLSDPKSQEFEAKYTGAPFNTYFDGQRVYLADPSDMTLKYYDPVKNTICDLTDYEFGKYSIRILGLNGSRLILAFRDELYVVDVSGREEIPLEEYVIILHGKVVDIENEIRDQYSINILTGKAAVQHLLGNIKADAVEDDFRIYYSIKQIYRYIKRFGKDFFKEFRYGTSQGLYVLMTGITEVTNDGAAIDAGGVAFRSEDRFYMILNINTDYTGRNFCHELMHSMEQNTDGVSLFPEWKKYNPQGFMYAGSYAVAADSKYSIEGPDGYDVYFYDVYSKTNELEDRARIFENIVAVEKDESRVNELPKLKAKALYIRERLYKLYPSLKDTDIFKNLDG